MERAGVKNNDHYHAPKEKSLETLLEQMEKHTLYVPKVVQQAQEQQEQERKREIEREAPRQPEPKLSIEEQTLQQIRQSHTASKSKELGWSR